jgi:hypothetical protein
VQAGLVLVIISGFSIVHYRRRHWSGN